MNAERPETAPGADSQIRCPLCGKPNRCGVAAGGRVSECWCQHVTITGAALDAIPDSLQDLACLCVECATSESPPVAPA